MYNYMAFIRNFTPFGSRRLKVSKSRKQVIKFSSAPKKEQKYFCIPALDYNKRSNQKSSAKESKQNPSISGIKCPLI